MEKNLIDIENDLMDDLCQIQDMLCNGGNYFEILDKELWNI